MLQPGPHVIAENKGLQSFTQWKGPMMTDSGGYQIFSLGHGSVSEEIKGKNKNIFCWVGSVGAGLSFC